MVEQVALLGPPTGAAEPGHPVLDVRHEALAGLLPVIADVDASAVLGGDDSRGGFPDRLVKLGRVRRLTPAAPPMKFGQPHRAGQAPRVGRQDPLVAGEHEGIFS
jgi:hypothetical protein